jgi:hypothetical protein
MALFLAPSAFRTPISLVLSVTETTMIFIRAIEEPRMVIIPISHAETPRKPVMLAILLTKSSLREIPKLSSSTGFSFLIFRIVSVALSMAGPNNSAF